MNNQNDELKHTILGKLWEKHKYIDKVRTRSGKWRYIYPEDRRRQQITSQIGAAASKVSGAAGRGLALGRQLLNNLFSRGKRAASSATSRVRNAASTARKTVSEKASAKRKALSDRVKKAIASLRQKGKKKVPKPVVTKPGVKGANKNLQTKAKTDSGTGKDLKPKSLLERGKEAFSKLFGKRDRSQSSSSNGEKKESRSVFSFKKNLGEKAVAKATSSDTAPSGKRKKLLAPTATKSKKKAKAKKASTAAKANTTPKATDQDEESDNRERVRDAWRQTDPEKRSAGNMLAMYQMSNPNANISTRSIKEMAADGKLSTGLKLMFSEEFDYEPSDEKIKDLSEYLEAMETRPRTNEEAEKTSAASIYKLLRGVDSDGRKNGFKLDDIRKLAKDEKSNDGLKLKLSEEFGWELSDKKAKEVSDYISKQEEYAKMSPADLAEKLMATGYYVGSKLDTDALKKNGREDDMVDGLYKVFMNNFDIQLPDSKLKEVLEYMEKK